MSGKPHFAKGEILRYGQPTEAQSGDEICSRGCGISEGFCKKDFLAESGRQLVLGVGRTDVQSADDKRLLLARRRLHSSNSSRQQFSECESDLPWSGAVYGPARLVQFLGRNGTLEREGAVFLRPLRVTSVRSQ